jgi:hypothetical protein
MYPPSVERGFILALKLVIIFIFMTSCFECLLVWQEGGVGFEQDLENTYLYIDLFCITCVYHVALVQTPFREHDSGLVATHQSVEGILIHLVAHVKVCDFFVFFPVFHHDG